MDAAARKTLKIDPELFEDLDEDRGDRTWNEYLRDLHNEAPIKRECNDIPDKRADEIVNRTAERAGLTDEQRRALVHEVGDEVEERLSR